MWTCSGCRESIDDEFDACWACGTSRDGVPDPTFRAVAESSDHANDLDAESQEPQTFEEAVAVRFRCVRCLGVGAVVTRVRLEHANLILPGRSVMFAATCARCSYTEWYNPDALEGTDDFAQIIDRLYGRS